MSVLEISCYLSIGSIVLPQLDLVVHAAGQDEVGGGGEPPDDGDTLGVP